MLATVAAVVLAAAGLPSGGTAPPSPAEPVRLTIAASGDFLVHSPVFDRALANGGGGRYDFAPMFQPVRPWIEGSDLALCHVETPLVPGPPAGYPLFRTPPALARAIRSTGWDVCSTASNHSLDVGQSGVDSTLRALRRAGLAYDGSASSPRGARRFPDPGGAGRARRAAQLHRGLQRPGRAPSLVGELRLAAAHPGRRARRPRGRRARGAGEPALGGGVPARDHAAQRSLARRLTRSPAITAIVGQHAHVVQPIRRVKGKVVVFGEGNLVSNQDSACCPAASQDGLIALLELEYEQGDARVARARYVPVWVRRPDYAVVPAPADSWQRTVGVVGRRSWLRPVPASP